MVSRGFFGRREESPRPIPPGQYLEKGFPVLSAGPTPRVALDQWSFSLVGSDGSLLASWSWPELLALPQTEIIVDIHCVTKWTKLDTTWKGVTIDTFLESAGLPPPDNYAMAFCEGGYTTNVPTADLLDGKAMVAWEYAGQPLEPAHGGPARLLVPHLYFWKSAKWVRGLRFMPQDQPGFWEDAGYHMYGDPWKEQRYWGD
jgi:DMSO/TMAO reductase YedYZ molybdopterin-dependent catalytic subunit